MLRRSLRELRLHSQERGTLSVSAPCIWCRGVSIDRETDVSLRDDAVSYERGAPVERPSLISPRPYYTYGFQMSGEGGSYEAWL